MKRTASLVLTAAMLVISGSGCASGRSEAGWITLVDATQGLDNFNRVGEANWTVTDEGIQATQTDNDPAYLVSKNVFDQRPDPAYGTGGIVNLAEAPDPMPKAGGRWNTYEITAQGTRLVLVLNGTTTVDVATLKGQCCGLPLRSTVRRAPRWGFV